MTAAVFSTVWLCLLADKTGFQKKWVILALGLSVLIGLGTKHLYVVFVALPLFLLIVRTFLRSFKPFQVSLRGRYLVVASLLAI